MTRKELIDEFHTIVKYKFDTYDGDIDYGFVNDNILSVGSRFNTKSDNRIVDFKSNLNTYIKRLIDRKTKFTEQLYLLLNEYDEFPKCPMCGKFINFRNFVYGFNEFCSKPCMTIGTRDRVKDTIRNRYGVDYITQTDRFKDSSRNTVLKKYGVENAAQSEEVKRKSRQTCLERYGVEHTLSVKEIRDKGKTTSMEKYGTDIPSKSDIIKDKVRKTNKERFGVDYPAQSEEIKKQIHEINREKYFNQVVNSDKVISRVTPNFTYEDYINAKTKYEFTCNQCGDIFQSRLDNTIPRCLNCFPYDITQSSYEKELYEFCKDLTDTSILTNNRSLLNPLELDIYLPEFNLAIEINGLLWHSESYGKKDKNYHVDKTNNCKHHGVDLFHIFEDEWLYKKNIVKSIIRHRLNRTENKIYARKCIVRKVETSEAIDFLDSNHLQGSINGVHVGLFEKSSNELVQILTVGKPRFNKNYDIEILRFCSKINTVVVGGLSKILNFIMNNYNVSSIISYSDRRYCRNDSYKYLDGFKFVGNSKPSYYYMSNYHGREHRMKYQKHKLENLLESYDPNLTEWQNMQLNGYDRIWDCGNVVYELVC